MAFRAARRIALSLAVSAMALSAGLASPLSVAARAACETDTCTLIRDSTSIVLARYRGTSGAFALFDVVDMLKGPSVRTERIRSNYFAPYSPRGRWLFVTNPDFGTMFRVSASGVVTDVFTGEGEPNDYPSTLAAWYRALGLRLPDSSTAPSAAPPLPPDSPVVLLAGAGLLGALLALRRASTPRRRTTC
jgi:hypothetical protein